MQVHRFLIFSLLLLMIAGKSFAQDEPVNQEDNQKPKPEEEIIFHPGMDTTGMNLQFDSIYIDEDQLNRPKKAAYLSAALPGLGQAGKSQSFSVLLAP